MKRVSGLYKKLISDDNLRTAIETANKTHRWVDEHHPNKKAAKEHFIDNKEIPN